MIANTKINLTLAIQSTDHLRDVLDMLSAYGVPSSNIKAAPEKKETLTVREPKAESTSHAKPEKGPQETAFLERAGLERMRVPADWRGSREEYATHRMHMMDFPAQAESVPSAEKLPEDDGQKFEWE